MAIDNLTASRFHATSAFAITPSDSTNIVNTTDDGVFVYVGVAGDIAVLPIGNQPKSTASVVFKNMAAGSILPVRVYRVNSTSTTATNLVAIR